ncbi:hypothetical protein V500_04620 [Pseudogymnoascus sp. VKM F-4518 (FW-2643)]|nr:hypothetical protein V500_04620 [Pseudogymnoascus sp. VKM F-4518 (FW-2643)]
MNVTSSISNSTNATSERLGWTDTPNARGSIDILYTCLSTIFLCSWTVLHLNIPSSSDTPKKIFLRKIKWMAIAIIVPEFVTALAFNQWRQAWTLKLRLKTVSWAQAWFCVSGGLRYSEIAPADPDVPGSVEGKYRPRTVLFSDDKGTRLTPSEAILSVGLPSDELIIAENKTDSLSKLIVVLQVTWFTAQCISRAAENLPISQLEIGTVAYVGCTMLTTAFWWHKPLDIRLWKSCSDSEVATLYKLGSGLDSPGTQICLGYYRLPNFAIDSELRARYQKTKPGSQKGEYEWVDYNGKDLFGFDGNSIRESIFGAILASLLGSIHIAAWNLQFSTNFERYGWRTSALIVTILPIFALGLGYAIVVVDLMRPIRWLGKVSDNATVRSAWNRRTDSMKLRLYHGFHLEKLVAAWGTPKDRLGPFFRNCFFALFGLLYCPARWLLIQLMFNAFKSMPAGVYVTVQWTDNILHI